MKLRSRNFAGALGLLSVLLVVLLAAILPTSGGAAPAGQRAAASSSAGPAHTPAGCAQEPASLETLLSATGEAAICPAASLPAAVSDGMRGGRTCRCSCGFPCKTDADCGGAIGSCRAGITCC